MHEGLDGGESCVVVRYSSLRREQELDKSMGCDRYSRCGFKAYAGRCWLLTVMQICHDDPFDRPDPSR